MRKRYYLIPLVMLNFLFIFTNRITPICAAADDYPGKAINLTTATSPGEGQTDH